MLNKILTKINIRKIIFPQVFCLKPQVIRNPWVFFPIFVLCFPYNIVVLSIYFISVFLAFCVLFLYEKWKNISA